MKTKKPSALLLMLNAEASDKASLQPLLFPNALSHNEVYSKLQRHVDTLDVRNGDGGYTKMHLVRAIYDDYYVYSVHEDGDPVLFQQGYSVSAADELVLGESITPVREKTEYIPLEAQISKEEKRSEERRVGKEC